jgi:hypothetical protein
MLHSQSRDYMLHLLRTWEYVHVCGFDYCPQNLSIIPYFTHIDWMLTEDERYGAHDVGGPKYYTINLILRLFCTIFYIR